MVAVAEFPLIWAGGGEEQKPSGSPGLSSLLCKEDHHLPCGAGKQGGFISPELRNRIEGFLQP